MMGDARPTRVLIASHSHPAITRGGAEIAAFQLFRAFCDLPGWEAWFLGCQNNRPNRRLGAAMTQPFSEREFVYSTGHFEWFKFANRDPDFAKTFPELLQRLQPDIVHFHHFINFGVEAFYHVRKVLPAAKIVLTVHEYLSICHHYGQMVTKGHETLCHEASPARCNQCFPDISPADFFLRKLYIGGFFAMVDHFISPSNFLAARLAAWGIPERRISVIENVISPADNAGAPGNSNHTGPLRIGFFGQISRLKGINVVFDAAELLQAEKFGDVVFDIHGDYRGQPPEFQEDFLKRLAGAGRNIRFHGPYDTQHADRLMRQVDITIVPSIWWENSPVVIQEALRNHRPVICSDIGGMAEKVRDGVDGWHFPAGSPIGLTALLRRLCRDRDLVGRVAATTRQPPEVRAVVDAHLHLFDTLRAIAWGNRPP
jgi:glycosyltransferase involved in cell wall biosynthesis